MSPIEAVAVLGQVSEMVMSNLKDQEVRCKADQDNIHMAIGVLRELVSPKMPEMEVVVDAEEVVVEL